MEDIVINHLESNYSFNLSTLNSYIVYDYIDKKDVYLKTLLPNLESMFLITLDEIKQIWEKWSNKKIIELNNKITDIRYKRYELYGCDVELTVFDINKMVNETNFNIF